MRYTVKFANGNYNVFDNVEYRPVAQRRTESAARTEADKRNKEVVDAALAKRRAN
jgi:hypothetical protein